MKESRQAILGILAAVLSAVLLFGSLSLALLEGSMGRAPAPSPTLPPTPTLPLLATTSIALHTPAASQPVTSTPSPTLTFTPPPPGPCSLPSEWFAITVLPGDTLPSLAEAYHTTPSAIIDGNCLLSNILMPGMLLFVPGIPPTEPLVQCGPPAGWVFYTVRDDDTLYSLALYFKVSVPELMFANCLTSDLIRIGQKLYVPNLPTPTYYIPPTRTRTPTPTLTHTPTLVPTATLQPTLPSEPTSTWTPTPTPTPRAATGSVLTFRPMPRRTIRA